VPDFREAGYTIADVKLSHYQCDHIALSIPEGSAARGGVGDLLDHPTVLQILRHGDLGKYLWSLVGRELVAVKATLFNKTAESDWRVRWHQDRVVTVRERMNIEGYSAWSTKAGKVHVEPPARVLEQMLAVRVYVDNCGPENGPLRVIAGTHEQGKISPDLIGQAVVSGVETELCVEKGTMVVMRPLLLHSSPTANVASHRRVLHIELSPIEAISPLQWDQAVRLLGAA
jgi:hypothetical protein